MRDSTLLNRALALSLSLWLALVPHRAEASVFGEENIALSALVAQGVSQLQQVSQAIETARQQLQVARDVYAGVNDFRNFDPQTFLDGQKQQWLSQVPLATDVQSFVSDVRDNGLSGGRFDANALASRFDVYRDAYRRREAAQALGGPVAPYDARTAMSVSREAERALSSPTLRQQLTAQPEPTTLSDGLFAADAARVDPQLLALYVKRRAAAKEAEYQAFRLTAEAMGASPGKAQQLAAMATGLSAQELARIDDKMSTSVTLQQLDRQEKAVGSAVERRDFELLYENAASSLKRRAKGPTRSAGDAYGWER